MLPQVGDRKVATPTGTVPVLALVRRSGLVSIAARGWRYLARSPRVFSAAAATVLLVLTFSDVIFRDTSLRMTDQLWGAYEDLPLHRVYPWNPLALVNST